MILHIVSAEPCGGHLLRLSFSDGSQKTVDATPLLCGPVFEALQDPSFFAQVSVDPECRTVVWPNGADLAPEALSALSDVTAPVS